MVDLHNISRELLHTTRMQRQFWQYTAVALSTGSVDGTRRKLTSISDAVDEVLTYWRDEELRPSEFVSPPTKIPLLGLV